jgi:hypothetical protein
MPANQNNQSFDTPIQPTILYKRFQIMNLLPDSVDDKSVQNNEKEIASHFEKEERASKFLWGSSGISSKRSSESPTTSISAEQKRQKVQEETETSEMVDPTIVSDSF